MYLILPLVLVLASIAAAAGARVWATACRDLRTRRWISYLQSTLPTWTSDDDKADAGVALARRSVDW